MVVFYSFQDSKVGKELGIKELRLFRGRTTSAGVDQKEDFTDSVGFS